MTPEMFGHEVMKIPAGVKIIAAHIKVRDREEVIQDCISYSSLIWQLPSTRQNANFDSLIEKHRVLSISQPQVFSSTVIRAENGIRRAQANAVVAV